MESNRKENNTNTYQPGGTSILCINQVAHQTQQPGDDLTGLRQWCWTCIQAMTVFLDSNYAGDSETKISVTGFLCFLDGSSHQLEE